MSIMLDMAAPSIAATSSSDATSDEDLLRAHLRGDSTAFGQLYERHALAVWRFVLRSVQQPELADDLAQDVWMAAIRHLDRWEPRARFRTWLFTLAHHRMVDHWRAQRPHVSLDADDAEGAALADMLAVESGFGPLVRLHGKEQAQALLDALAALPDVQREAFLLQAEAGMSVQEIAETTGVGQETAKSRLRYARAHLRKTLEMFA